MKSTLLVVLSLTLGGTQALFAQTEGDYRSVASGNWDAPATWERFTGGTWQPAGTAPSAADGLITIQNGTTVTVAATTTADQLTVASGGTLSINNSFTVSDGAGTDLQNEGTVNIASATSLAGSIVNNNSINWSAGNITFEGATLDNNGTLTNTGDAQILAGTGTNLFNNTASGLLTRTAGATQTIINISVANAGTINVSQGILRFAGASSTTFNNTGAIVLANNSTFTLAFRPLTFASGSTLTGTGFFRGFGAITLDTPLTVPAGVEYVSADNLAGTGSLAIDGRLRWEASNIRVPVTIAAGGFLDIVTTTAKVLNGNLTNNGTANWNAGNINFNNATLTNNAQLELSFAANTSAALFAGTTAIINSASGILNKTNSASTFTVTGIPATNNGQLYGIGTIDFAGGFTNNGRVNPGGTGIGSLTINPTAVSSTSRTDIRIAEDGTNDVLNLTGSADLSGSTLVVTENSAAPQQTYTIMTTSGTFSGTFGTAVIPGGYTLAINASTVTVTKTVNTLPVKWGSFTVAAASQQALLSWSTLEEVNTAYFAIEFGTNGRSFTEIGRVAARGNSSQVSEYSFRHAAPVQNGNSYYRIRQVDLDGKGTFSEVRFLGLSGGREVAILIAPNPVADVLRIQVPAAPVQVILTDLTGRTLRSLRLGVGSHSVAVSDLQAGTYLVSVYQNGNRIATQQIVKQ